MRIDVSGEVKVDIQVVWVNEKIVVLFIKMEKEWMDWKIQVLCFKFFNDILCYMIFKWF